MSKRKLLLADDSVTIQKVVNLTFADEGIEVISVGDGDSAMEKVAEISPDLIMADVNMPGLTGYEICERIRQDDKLRRTPVILLVGSFEPFDEDEARRVGADDYLTKPFQSIRQLVNKVTVLLNSQSNENGDRAEMKDSSSLEDTLEMDAGEISVPSQSAQFSDTGYDDEMIQTNRPSSFAFDETQKFETRETEELIIPQSTLPQENTEEDLLEDYASATEESAQETIEVAERVSDDLETGYFR
ncbi:MAG: response regulator [Blastocatellia bacterium]|nr:response regulator [Blastocatellia bacterium]